MTSTSNNNHWPRSRQLMLTCLVWLSLSFPTAAANRAAVAGGTSLNPGSSWGYYNGADAPEGAYLQEMPTATNTIIAVVALGTTLNAGAYRAFVKCIDYDQAHCDINYTLGDGTGSGITDDRDVYKYWSAGVNITSTVAFSSATIEFDKVIPGTAGKILFMSLYITADLGEVVLNTDESFTYVEPYVGSDDDSDPVEGNIIYNGSFELPLINQGQNDQQQIVLTDWEDHWSTDEAHTGSKSIRLPTNPGGSLALWNWQAQTLASNKWHTFSLWAKTDAGTAYGNFRIVNVHTAPTGFTNTQYWYVSGSNTVGSTWQELKVTGRVAQYPISEVALSFDVQTNSGSTYIYLDDLQIVEGTDAPTWAPMYPIELGVDTGKTGDIYLVGEADQNLKAYVYNYTDYDLTRILKWEVYNWKNSRVETGSMVVTCTGNTTNIYNIPVSEDNLGWFKGNFWLEGQNNAIELSWTVLRVHSIAPDADHTLGVHSNFRNTYQNAIMERAGFAWYRGLSTGQWWHWGARETNDNEFATHFGPWITAPAANNITVLATFYQQFDDGLMLSWMTNVTMRITNTTDVFTVGERVTNTVSSSGGWVSFVEYTNTAFIQLSNVVGTVVDGDTITGVSSGATAELFENGFLAFDVPQWSNFVYTAMAADSNTVYAAECLNEPDEAGFPNWLYAKLLWKFAEAIELGDNNVKVVALGGRGFNGSNPLGDAEEILGLLPNTTRIDYASLHFYPGNEGVAHWFNTNWSYPTISLWNTESGWFGYDGLGGFSSSRRQGAENYVWPWRSSLRKYSGIQNATEAIARNYLRTIGAGFTKWFYYDARQGGSDINDYTSHTSLYNWRRGLRPVGAAISSIGYWLHHAQGHNLIDAGNDNVIALLFTRDSEDPIVAIWSEDDTPRTMTLSSDIGIADFSLYDIMGNSLPVATRTFSIGRVPVIIESLNSTTTNTLKSAVLNGTLASRTDTVAPNVSFEIFPVTAISDAYEIKVYAYDDDDFPNDTASSALEYRWHVHGGAWTDWSPATTFFYTGLISTIYVEARDSAGNTSASEVSFYKDASVMRGDFELQGNATIR